MNIINLILSLLFSTIMSYFTVVNFSKNQKSVKSFIIYFVIMFPFFLLINLFFDNAIKIIAVLILMTIALYFSLFNKSISNSLYYSTVYELFAFIAEIVLSVIFVSIFNFDLNSYNNFSISILIFSVLNSLAVYLISKIKKFDNLLQNFNKIITKKQYEIIYITIIFALMILMIIFNRSNLSRDLSFYINVGMIIFVFMTLIYFVYRNIQNKNLENKYRDMMEHVCKYEKIINEQGKKNHEYNNQLMVIKGYSHNPKKLEEYLNLIIEEHKCGQNYIIRQLSYFPDGGIKGLMYDKLSKMEENDIKCYLYVDQHAKDIFEDKFEIKTYQDITKLLGVFLDNAIDATLKADKPEIEIDVKVQDDCSIINISNTYNNELDVNQVGKKGFTTKGIGHGFGLSIVKDISKHNESIETIREVEDEKFKQTIIIYYEK